MGGSGCEVGPEELVSCPDHTSLPAGKGGLATQAAMLGLPDVLKPVNCTCENANN